ncbi:MAG TPA: ribonuclease HI family protein [Candidatus Pacearchaeota archaeon]|nr:ribonuclease HI family protein [Candidatus Pacearchaeota archaeon]HOK94097.1 ribonuclease HI family protein [Candidatus Pacearchaeota archaeon]HPO75225.1 ribonuclease HI family protein [Candidatus Pacearchaeota archaeon]
MKFIVHTDGGARGNPGPAAIGVVIQLLTNNLQLTTEKQYSEYIGKATNNEAEYMAIIFALKKLKQLFGKNKIKNLEVEIYLDSQLIARQLQGKYKILEKNLQPLFLKVWNLKTEFKNVNFNYVPREKNREADKLVNEALDNLERRI